MASSSAASDPCTLLSADEVNTATGLDAGSGESSTSGGAKVCTWTATDGSAAIVQLYSSASRYEESREAFESIYGGTAENLSGVADQAFFIGGSTVSIPTATVSVMKGQQAASVQLMTLGGDGADLRARVLALTEQLASKL